MPEEFDIKEYVMHLLEENGKADLRPKNMSIDDFLRYNMHIMFVINDKNSPRTIS